MEKGDIAHFEQFHLFPQCFPTFFFFNVLNRVYMEERVNREIRTCYDFVMGSYQRVWMFLILRKWLTNPVRKLSTSKIEKGSATILEGQRGELISKQTVNPLAASKVRCRILESHPSVYPCFVIGQQFKILLTLSQMINFRLFHTKRVCRRQFQVWWKWQNVFQTGRKHCGKRRNCSLWAISPFPTLFSKDFYCRHVKTRACLGKG